MPPSTDRRKSRRATQAGESLSLLAFLISAAVGVVLVGLLSWTSGEVYESVVENDGAAGWDQPALREALSLRSDTANHWATVFTWFGGGKGLTILAGVIALALALAWRRWTPVVLMSVATTGSLLMTVTGKHITARARPPLADAVPPYLYSPSFPSGHTLNTVVVAGVAAYLVVLHVRSRALRAAVVLVAVGWSIAMGLSRVYLGHHWLTDVIAGWLIGLAWLAAVVTAHRGAVWLRGRMGGSARSAVEES